MIASGFYSSARFVGQSLFLASIYVACSLSLTRYLYDDVLPSLHGVSELVTGFLVVFYTITGLVAIPTVVIFLLQDGAGLKISTFLASVYVVYVVFSPQPVPIMGESRLNAVVAILLVPPTVLLTSLFFLVMALMAGFILFTGTLRVVSRVFLEATGWRWVISCPRFRVLDPFSQSQLCSECEGMLRSSALVFGKRKLLVRSEESYPFVVQEPKLVSPGTNAVCQLCLLIFNEYHEMRAHWGKRQQNLRTFGYNTFIPCTRDGVRLEEEAIVDLVISDASARTFPFRDEDCFLEMTTAEGISSRFSIMKGENLSFVCVFGGGAILIFANECGSSSSSSQKRRRQFKACVPQPSHHTYSE